MRIPPPLVALAAAVAQRALTRDASPATTPRAAAAIGVALPSVGMAAASASQFRRTGTTVEPFAPDRTSALVTTGVNSISRNPMYLGMAGLLVANAIRRGAWAALLPAAGFAVVISRLQVAAEESALRTKFGDEYEAYCRAVPRWLDRRSVGAFAAVARRR
jgi:protein-S-isoprenylcysteine O-methyltransferase Ste14